MTSRHGRCDRTVSIVAIAAALFVAPMAAATTDVEWLTPPTVVERTLGRCAPDEYRLLLRQGESLRGFVEQDTVMTTVEIVRVPDQVTVGTFNTSQAEGGFERFLLIIEETAEYRLSVRFDDEGQGDELHGPYRLHVEPPTPTTPQDRLEATGEAILALPGTYGNVALTEMALDLCEEANAIACQADALQALAHTTRHTDPRLGRELLIRSAALRNRMGDRFGEGSMLSDLGLFQRWLGELTNARATFERALSLRTTSLVPVNPLVLHNAAPVYWQLGEMQTAIDAEKKVLEVWSRFGDERGVAHALSLLGNFTLQLGDTTQAMRYASEALQIWTRQGQLHGIAESTLRVGTILEAEGKRIEALEHYRKALDLWKAWDDRSSRAVGLTRMGGVLTSLGRLTEARKVLTEALEITRAANFDEAPVDQALGRLEAASGKPAEALRWYEAAREVASRNGSMTALAEAILAVARSQRDLGRLKEARATVETATAIIESLRLRLANPDVRASYFAARQDYFELEIDILMQLARRGHPHHEHDAFDVSERARARGLLDWLTVAGVRERSADASLAARELETRTAIGGKADTLARLSPQQRDQPPGRILQQELDDLLVAYRDIRSEMTRAMTAEGGQTLEIDRIQQFLDRDTVLIEYALGTPRSYLWVVSPSAVRAFELPPRATVELLARRVATLLANSHKRETMGEATMAAARLSAMVLGPAASLLRGKRLLIVSDGALQFVPFAALPDPAAPGQPLVASHEIAVLPSASMLAVRRQARTPGFAEMMLAVFADPVVTHDDARLRRRGTAQAMPPDLLRSVAGLRGGFVPLPHTRVEAEAISAMIPAARRWSVLGFEASRETVLRGELQRYRLVHFATHGLLNAEHPELSGLVLSLYRPDGSAQDGFLRLTDIYSLDLNADLVVISGCRSALGRDVHREGMIGVTRGFMSAGARRVVASLWDVRDNATAELMRRFYSHLMGKSGLRPAAALRAAQRSMAAEPRWSAPFYWAGFVLHETGAEE